MSAVKSLKTARSNPPPVRKSERVRSGTKPARNASKANPEQKRQSTTAVGRKPAPVQAQVAEAPKQSGKPQQKGKAMTKPMATESTLDEKALHQDIPVTDASEPAQDDTETVLKALDREVGGDSTLSKYFREMAQHRVLTRSP